MMSRTANIISGGHMTEEECEKLRKIAHEIPMNPVYQDHKGRRFLGNHSMAWAVASRNYFEAKKRLEEE